MNETKSKKKLATNKLGELLECERFKRLLTRREFSDLLGITSKTYLRLITYAKTSHVPFVGLRAAAKLLNLPAKKLVELFLQEIEQ